MRWEPREPPEGINVSATHPLAELATLLAGIAAALAVFVVAGAFLVDQAVARLPGGLEARLFGGLWADHVPAGDHARAEAGRALLARMADHWTDRPYALRLRVVPSAEPNAFALPGGVVGVTTGLLDEVDSENELAFVLGHELGHFRGRHHLKGLGRALVVHLVLASAAGAGGADALSDVALAFAETGFARGQEREADAFALELLAAEYGHVHGADHFFRRLPDAGDAGLAERAATYLATHPLSADRIEALGAAARTRGYPTAGELAALP